MDDQTFRFSTSPSCFHCFPFSSIPNTTHLHPLLFVSGLSYLHGGHLLGVLEKPSANFTHPLNPRERRIIHFLLRPLLPHSSDYHNFFFLYCLPFLGVQVLKFLLSYITTTTPQIFCTATPVPQTKFPPPASFPIKHIHSYLHPELTLACLVQSYPHHCPFKGQWWIFLSLPLHPYLYPGGIDPSKLFRMLIETHLFTRIHVHRLLLKGNTQNQANIGIKLSRLLPTQLPNVEFLPGKDTQIYLI